MGLFKKRQTGVFFIVITNEVAREAYVERIDELEFRKNSTKYDKFARFDNDKDAIKNAKDYVKHFKGWVFCKEKCKL